MIGKTSLFLAALALSASASAEPAIAPQAGPLPDTFLSRLEVLAAVETLNAELLAGTSATKTLENWCAVHHFAMPAKIHAERVANAPDKPLKPEQRARLGIDAKEPVKYRRVRLVCGDRALSEADNWYVPSRLTPEMNKALETTDVPFGQAVAALKFRRETFSSELLWSVLPMGWETRPRPQDHPDSPLTIPPVLFEHRAVLYDEHHRPFSQVDERYLRQALSFP